MSTNRNVKYFILLMLLVFFSIPVFFVWDAKVSGACRSIVFRWVNTCDDEFYRPYAGHGIAFSAPNYLDVITFESSIVGGEAIPWTQEQLTEIFFSAFKKKITKKFPNQEIILSKDAGKYSYKDNPHLSKMIFELREGEVESGLELSFSIKRSAIAIMRTTTNPRTYSLLLTTKNSNQQESSDNCLPEKYLKEAYAYKTRSFFYQDGGGGDAKYLDMPYRGDFVLDEDRFVSPPQTLRNRIAKSSSIGRPIPNVESQIDIVSWVEKWADEYAFEYAQKARPESKLTRILTEKHRACLKE